MRIPMYVRPLDPRVVEAIARMDRELEATLDRLLEPGYRARVDAELAAIDAAILGGPR